MQRLFWLWTATASTDQPCSNGPGSREGQPWPRLVCLACSAILLILLHAGTQRRWRSRRVSSAAAGLEAPSPVRGPPADRRGTFPAGRNCVRLAPPVSRSRPPLCDICLYSPSPPTRPLAVFPKSHASVHVEENAPVSMAAYHDAYASRDRHERRRESPQRLRVDSHLSSGDHNRHDKRRPTSRYRYDRDEMPRLSRHHTASPERRHSAYPSRSPARRRRSWPPQPFAEDETTSLRREAGSGPRLKELHRSQVPSRGSIDQEPILLDLSPPKPPSSEIPSRKPHHKATDSKIVTPLSSEDETSRNARRRQSPPRRSNVEDVPELNSRRPSPYSWNNQGTSTSTNAKDDVRSQQRDTASKPSSSAEPRSTRDLPRISSLHDRRGDTLNGRRPPSLASSQSYHGSDSPAFVPPHLAPSATDLPSRPRHSTTSGHRSVSPANSNGRTARTPPRSPRLSGEFKGASAASSRAGSTNGSRPPSPGINARAQTMPRIGTFDHDWSALQSVVAPRKGTKQSSRLSAEIPPDVVAGFMRRDGPPSTQGSLPYPVDDNISIIMPSEIEHQWRAAEGFVSTVKDPSLLIRMDSAPVPGAPFAQMPSSSGTLDMPGLETRASTWPSPNPDRSRDNGHRQNELAASVKNKPPHCPRLYLEEGSSDWSTVRGSANIHFCPECVLPMRGTSFESHLRAFQPPSRNTRIYCAFELPWMVRAWMYTLHDQRGDFSILRSVADTDRCLGPDSLRRSAKGVIVPDSTASGGLAFLPGFHLCAEDYRKVKLLLPRAANLFVDKPVADPEHLCAINTESSTFRAYWDALETINTKAKGANGNIDPAPLIEAVARKRRSREAARRREGR